MMQEELTRLPRARRGRPTETCTCPTTVLLARPLCPLALGKQLHAWGALLPGEGPELPNLSWAVLVHKEFLLSPAQVSSPNSPFKPPAVTAAGDCFRERGAAPVLLPKSQTGRDKPPAAGPRTSHPCSAPGGARGYRCISLPQQS